MTEDGRGEGVEVFDGGEGLLAARALLSAVPDTAEPPFSSILVLMLRRDVVTTVVLCFPGR
jgi:hypothetical protein